MKILLDTHIILWSLKNDQKLSEKARRIILDENNDIYYSVASMWEVTIKHMASPQKMGISGKELSILCKKMHYKILSISEEDINMLETLHREQNAPKHNDPFDRILIAQAKAQNCMFLTHDSLIPFYNEPCVISV